MDKVCILQKEPFCHLPPTKWVFKSKETEGTTDRLTDERTKLLTDGRTYTVFMTIFLARRRNDVFLESFTLCYSTTIDSSVHTLLAERGLFRSPTKFGIIALRRWQSATSSRKQMFTRVNRPKTSALLLRWKRHV